MDTDETVKTLYNAFEETHHDDYDPLDDREPDTIDLSPADRQILEDQYGDLAGKLTAYQHATEQLKEAYQSLKEQSEAMAGDLPETMAEDDLTTRITYEPDIGSGLRFRPTDFVLELEDNLRGRDDRMLADYLVMTHDDGDEIVTTWDGQEDDWETTLYHAIEDNNVVQTIERLHGAERQYQMQAQYFREALEDALTVDDDQGLLGRLKETFTGGNLYY